MRSGTALISAVLLGLGAVAPAQTEGGQGDLPEAVSSLLKNRCVKCHGPAAAKARLNLSTPTGIRQGGKKGPAVVPGDLRRSLIWERVAAEEMPPDEPLPVAERDVLRAWIAGGALGLPRAADRATNALGHWAFRPLAGPKAPAVRDAGRVRTAIDAFVQAALEQRGLSLGPDANRLTLLRRVCFDLTGLPPTVAEIHAFLADPSPDAYERMVERYLASPHYGERWGKYWLDAAGYADSTGYFSGEFDRPLAYRYRDYVVRAFNGDKPFDRFIREQLAGDELAGWKPGQEVSAEVRELLEATHFLRNGPDGTDQSAPSPEAMRLDRYAALEGTQEIVTSSLLGLTVKCARCHAHKFEPIDHEEYYRLQAVFYAAFNPVNWIIPKKRVVHVPLPGETAAWQRAVKEVDARLAAARREFAEFARKHRQRGEELLHEPFDGKGTRLGENWSVAAGGAFALDERGRPGAVVEGGALRLTGGKDYDAWLVTRQTFDWRPPRPGDWVQVTFDLVGVAEGNAGGVIQYVLGARDVQGVDPELGGNLCVKADSSQATLVSRLVKGPRRMEKVGTLGELPCRPGRRYGVRLTNIDGARFNLEQLVGFVPEGRNLIVPARDLAPGGFAFHAGPSQGFHVANLLIEQGSARNPVARLQTLFVDDGGGKVAAAWSAAAPGDQPPDNAARLDVDRAGVPCACRRGAHLRLLAPGDGETWVSTRQRFDWTPDRPGQFIQATFDLVADRTEIAGAPTAPAGSFGYAIAAHNFGRRRPAPGGNLRIDGSTAGAVNVSVNSPGPEARTVAVGFSRYVPGRNYGVRVTNLGDGRFCLHHLADRLPEGKPLVLTAADLPDGGFAFFLGASRSFVVANVLVETGQLKDDKPLQEVNNALSLERQWQETRRRLEEIEARRPAGPGAEVAWVSDVSPKPPEVFSLKRGLYGQPDRPVQPAGLRVLTDPDNPFTVEPPAHGTTTGRRLALANWLTRPGSRAAALVARVQSNRIWQYHFGAGLVPTPDNFGLSGSPPTHPELLDHLARQLTDSGWSVKSLHRAILGSSVYRQSSLARPEGLKADSDNRLLWRYRLHRLDAEAIRDGMLAASGELDRRPGGPYVPSESGSGEFGSAAEAVVPETAPGAHRRSLYLQQRRTRVPTFLALFDAPSIAINCVERSHSTTPLQSLSQLNSGFAVGRAKALAARLQREAGAVAGRQVTLAFLLTAGREPSPEERADSLRFLQDQRVFYAGHKDVESRALADLCQLLFASNLFLYVE